MSKVIFEINGKSREVDIRDLKSQDDIKMAMFATLNEATNVTETLAVTDAWEVALKHERENKEALAAQREAERVKEAERQTAIANNFLLAFDTWKKYCQEHVGVDTPEVNARRTELEIVMLMCWKQIKREKLTALMKRVIPAIKTIAKMLDNNLAYYKQQKMIK